MKFYREPNVKLHVSDLWRNQIAGDAERMGMIWFAYARHALSAGLLALELPADTTIMVPHFICDVVVDVVPQHWKIQYYYLDKSLCPDQSKLDQLDIRANTVVFLLVHYFGFAAHPDKMAEYCRARQWILVEDNAHGFGSTYKDKPLGHHGVFSICSPRKVLPVRYGGLLKLNIPRLKEAIAYPILASPRLGMRQMLSCLKRIAEDRIDWFPNHNSMPLGVMPAHDHVPALHQIDRNSQNIICVANTNVIKSKRRQLYEIWQKFAENKGLQSIYSLDDQGASPLCFPAWAENHQVQMQWLQWGRRHRIDIYPWPSLPNVMRHDKCSADFWRRLICFPLHQGVDLNKLVDFLGNISYP